jgi:hypothetical protein
LDGARDISAVFYVKTQIGGKFLVERLFQLFTMASARFATFSTQGIEKIVQNKDSKNTKKSTKLAREVFNIYIYEKLIISMNIYLFSIVACFVFFLSQNE